MRLERASFFFGLTAVDAYVFAQKKRVRLSNESIELTKERRRCQPERPHDFGQEVEGSFKVVEVIVSIPMAIRDARTDTICRENITRDW